MRKEKAPQLAFQTAYWNVSEMKFFHPPRTIVTLAAVIFFTGTVPHTALSQDTSKPATSSSAVGEDVMYRRLDQFFRLVSDAKVKNAYEGLTKGSKSIREIAPLVSKTEAVIKGNGQIVDAELLRTSRVGKRLVRISYLTHGEIYPMQWNFYCYRSSTGWQVLDITVNNDLYAIFDEEEREKLKEKK